MKNFKHKYKLFVSVALLFALPTAVPAFANASTPDSLSIPSHPLESGDVIDVDAFSNAAATSPSILVAAAPSSAQAWNNVLQTYINLPDGRSLARFDYARLKANRADYQSLANYISELERQDVQTFADKEAISYWANLYNAATIKAVSYTHLTLPTTPYV